MHINLAHNVQPREELQFYIQTHCSVCVGHTPACVSWWLLIHGTVVALSQSSTERESEPDCRLHSHGLGRVFCLLAGALNPVCRLPLHADCFIGILTSSVPYFSVYFFDSFWAKRLVYYLAVPYSLSLIKHTACIQPALPESRDEIRLATRTPHLSPPSSLPASLIFSRKKAISGKKHLLARDLNPFTSDPQGDSVHDNSLDIWNHSVLPDDGMK